VELEHIAALLAETRTDIAELRLQPSSSSVGQRPSVIRAPLRLPNPLAVGWASSRRRGGVPESTIAALEREVAVLEGILLETAALC
jgi:hypothetical protein